jgi:nucleotide-binding universal stress UspA family protein
MPESYSLNKFMTFKKILIAVDNELLSGDVAAKGIELGRSLKASIAIIHVADSSLAIGNPEAGILAKDSLELLKISGEKTIEKILKENALTREDVKVYITTGKPGEKIIVFSEQWQADLIVAGKHNKKALRHLLLGSASEYLLKNSKVPVMIFPGN